MLLIVYSSLPFVTIKILSARYATPQPFVSELLVAGMNYEPCLLATPSGASM